MNSSTSAALKEETINVSLFTSRVGIATNKPDLRRLYGNYWHSVDQSDGWFETPVK